jgi:hypothetical protein
MTDDDTDNGTHDDTGAAWRAAGERFVALGASLKAHYEEQRGSRQEAGAEDLGDAARRFAGAIADAVDAVGAAASDPGVTRETRQTGAAVADALGTTFADVAAQLHRLAAGARDETSPPGAADEGHREEGGEGTGPRVEPWGTP